jgi:hypothetical protein
LTMIGQRRAVMCRRAGTSSFWWHR